MDAVVDAVTAHLDHADLGGVIGCYLYGSATAGGLRPDSDVDLLVLTRRTLTQRERRALVGLLLPLSGWPGHRETFPDAADRRPVELTSVVLTDDRPWSGPAERDFQYGEWMRADLLAGTVPAPETDPDLAILLATALGRHRPLRGPALEELISPVPEETVRRAMLDLVPGALDELASGDERNMLLLLARILVTLETGEIVPKDVAAARVAPGLPARHAELVERARRGYLGEAPDDWSGLADRVRAAAEHMSAAAVRSGSVRSGGVGDVGAPA